MTPRGEPPPDLPEARAEDPFRPSWYWELVVALAALVLGLVTFRALSWGFEGVVGGAAVAVVVGLLGGSVCKYLRGASRLEKARRHAKGAAHSSEETK